MSLRSLTTKLRRIDLRYVKVKEGQIRREPLGYQVRIRIRPNCRDDMVQRKFLRRCREISKIRKVGYLPSEAESERRGVFRNTVEVFRVWKCDIERNGGWA
jgi:hypothetical protein